MGKVMADPTGKDGRGVKKGGGLRPRAKKNDGKGGSPQKGSVQWRSIQNVRVGTRKSL